MTDATLYVHGAGEAHGVADVSPFVLKVKTYLRMTGVPYEARRADPRKGPTKKMPYIDDGGTVVGDSGLILEYLKKKHGDKLDAKLSEAEHALGHLVRRTLEESLYWSVIYSRWLDDAHWPLMEAFLKPLMPPLVGGFVANSVIRGGVRKQIFAQGVGRHAPDQIYALGCADVDAIAATLGTKPYILGDAPSSYDAILYGFAANLLAFPRESPICKRGHAHENLVSYVDRMKAAYWATPDKRS